MTEMYAWVNEETLPHKTNRVSLGKQAFKREILNIRIHGFAKNSERNYRDRNLL